jgi:hypothetical protein
VERKIAERGEESGKLDSEDGRKLKTIISRSLYVILLKLSYLKLMC